jgi:phosphocarrier protein HPr
VTGRWEETVLRQAKVMICNPLGLHARPAAELVKIASRFRSRVKLCLGEDEVDGKSIMGVMMLAAPRGSELLVRAEGVDEEAAVEALVGLIKNGFGES